MPETQIKKIVESELQASGNTNFSNNKSQKPQKCHKKKKRPLKKSKNNFTSYCRICFITYCFVGNSYPFSAI